MNNTLRVLLSLLAASLLLSKSAAFAGVEVREFDSDKNRQRYHQMIDELRCLVCQNQNLADSNAQLAVELRTIIYDMIKSGKSDQEIVDYMVARYGEFVLYNPPLDRATFMLWFGPILLLLLVLFLLIKTILARQDATPIELTDEQRARSRELLDTDEDKDQKP